MKPSSSLVWRSVWTSLEDQPKVVPVCFGPSPCKSLATYVGGYVVHIEYVTYTQLGENPNSWLVSCRYRGTGSASATCDPHRSLADIHLVPTVTGPITCGRERKKCNLCVFCMRIFFLGGTCWLVACLLACLLVWFLLVLLGFG